MPSPNPTPELNSEIRKHYFLNHYVIIAPKRNLRPDSFSRTDQPHKLPNPHCPFCHNQDPVVVAFPGGSNWNVKVVPNAFPALTTTTPQAYGVQEVLIDTPDHTQEFSELSLQHINDLFAAWRHRLTHLKALPGIRYVLIFKNDGPAAGASVAHAHCQIFGLPLIPPQLAAEAEALTHYQEEHNTCAICDLLSWEQRQQTRLIFEDKHFLALAPYASERAFEVWVVPKRHISEFTELSFREQHSLAVILKKLTATLDAAVISFNIILQESIEHQNHHLLIKVEPQTNRWAGAEIGTGVIINPVPPEYAALWYQGKITSNSE